jgi:hypothetical protein
VPISADSERPGVFGIPVSVDVRLLYSNTKVLTACAVWLLVERGALAVGAPIVVKADGLAAGVGRCERRLRAAAKRMGMTTLREDGIRLCRAGVTSLEEVHRVTGDRLM